MCKAFDTCICRISTIIIPKALVYDLILLRTTPTKNAVERNNVHYDSVLNHCIVFTQPRMPSTFKNLCM